MRQTGPKPGRKGESMCIEVLEKDGVEYASYKVYPWEGVFVCAFYAFGHPDTDLRGTYGTGCKFYDTAKQAIQAGRRYLKKF